MAISRKTGPRIVAVAEMTIAATATILILSGMLMISIHATKATGDKEQKHSYSGGDEIGLKLNEVAIMAFLALTCASAKFFLGFILWNGVAKDHYQSCRLWLYSTAIFWVLNLLSIFFTDKPISWLGLAFSMAMLAYQATSVFVVVQFMKTLRFGVVSKLKLTCVLNNSAVETAGHIGKEKCNNEGAGAGFEKV